MGPSRTALALLLVFAGPPLSRGGAPVETVGTKLIGSQLVPGSNFGETVQVAGGLMVVGAPDHYVPADAVGAVYFFVHDGEQWTEHGRLFASDSVLGDEFGAAISLHADTLFVGAPSRNGPSGEFEGGVYVFTRAPNGSWTQQAKLLPPGVAAPDRFGERVAVWGNLAAVLSNGSSSTGFQVHPFAQDGQGQWIPEAKVAPPFFAQDLRLVGTTLIVTGILSDQTVAAAVYEHVGSAWTLQTVLTDGDTGFSVRPAFDGQTLAVAHVSFLAPPGVSVYEREPPNGWDEQELEPPPIGRQASLGAGMALVGDRLAVGLLNDGGDDADSVIVFVPDALDTWHEEKRLVPPGFPIDNGFGFALSTDGVTLAIGALEDNQSRGAVFVTSFGATVPGEVPPSLTLNRSTGGSLTLSWNPSCAAGATDYEVYQGSLGDFASHTALFCTTNGTTTKTFVPGLGSSYYLVVPRTASSEGSYGRTSAESERPQGVSACLPQQLSACD